MNRGTFEAKQVNVLNLVPNRAIKAVRDDLIAFLLDVGRKVNGSFFPHTMPGANYMGGKRSESGFALDVYATYLHRNAVRAKLKDATSRAHKGFFCRQRLAKGLIADKTNNDDFPETKKKSEIALFHAKHNGTVNQRANHIETNQAEQSHATRTYDKDTQGRSACGISEATQCMW